LSTSPSLWPDILAILKPACTRATFSACLQGTRAIQQNGALTVLVPGPYALDWLEHRLRPQIEQAARAVAQAELEVRFEIDPGEPGETNQPELFFTGTYRDAYNEIVQPDLQHYASRYFHRQWLPILGPELWLLIWEMRTRCYWNKETGVKRDTFEATYKDLGESIGINGLKAWRALNPQEPERKALIARFVLRSETKRRYSSTRGGAVNDKTIWRIRLDDPLTPEDEAKLKVSNFTSEIREGL
jgi:chromosomal replication initiation ATPase DnaA